MSGGSQESERPTMPAYPESLHVKLAPGSLARIDAAAKANGQSRADWTRARIRAFLDSLDRAARRERERQAAS
jgi:hypothetical protein